MGDLVKDRPRLWGALASLGLVTALAILANRLARLSPGWLEYPLWAVGLGLAANVVLSAAGWQRAVAGVARTELFLKTGLVLMGATVNLRDILSVGARGALQALVVVSAVFLFTWYLGGRLRLDEKLRAVMSAAVAVCGVSAAIASAGAVVAQGEQLAYVTTLVVLFAVPMMILQPLAAIWLGLPPDVAGAWIGGNIDTTAAVVGAGTLHSERAMQVASIVKLSQNALIGVVAFLLALYWVTIVERSGRRPSPREIWARFPKFVLGFLAASLLVTLGLLSPAQVKAVAALRNWFLALAFVSIGVELSFGEIRQIGARPALVYLMATMLNTVLALGAAWVLFGR